MHTGVFMNLFAKQSPKRPLVAAKCLLYGPFRGLGGVGSGTVSVCFGGILRGFGGGVLPPPLGVCVNASRPSSAEVGRSYM